MDPNWIERLLTRFFPIEFIDGWGRQLYLIRWILKHTDDYAWYLHRFVGSDWSRDLHDHPKPFLSIGLWGSYIEETPEGKKTYRAPWIRTFPPEHIHRLILPEGKPVWTLVRVGKSVREWGFHTDQGWMQWEEYVKSTYADTRWARD